MRFPPPSALKMSGRWLDGGKTLAGSFICSTAFPFPLAAPTVECKAICKRPKRPSRPFSSSAAADARRKLLPAAIVTIIYIAKSLPLVQCWTLEHY